LLIIGTGAGKFMPKPGGWMEAVNKVFGVVMLGVAIWMISRIVDDSITMLLWAILFIFSAIYLRAFEQVEKKAHWFEYFKKALGITIFIYGLFLFYGAFSGATNPLEPLKALKKERVAAEANEGLFKSLKNLEELKSILKSKDIVLVDVKEKWCVSCKELDEYTFSNKEVQEILQKIEAYKFDVTDNSKEDKEFLKAFNLYGPPAILIFKNGKEAKRLIGFVDANTLKYEIEELM
jgi:thiol:disulfide interchange protein DsbD